jgi:hypothetical protein
VDTLKLSSLESATLVKRRPASADDNIKNDSSSTQPRSPAAVAAAAAASAGRGFDAQAAPLVRALNQGYEAERAAPHPVIDFTLWLSQQQADQRVSSQVLEGALNQPPSQRAGAASGTASASASGPPADASEAGDPTAGDSTSAQQVGGTELLFAVGDIIYHRTNHYRVSAS